jgi:LuxR family maltose regulon positive regulatory protein
MSERQGSKKSKPVLAGGKPVVDPVPPILTKIRVPRQRRDLLPRRRLVDFMHSQLDRKLVLVSAPAGYGKTSLLTEFAHDTELPACWYTLDPFDRDLHVFLDHLIAAISMRFPAFGQRSRSLLRETADPGSNMYPVVATLVQEIYDTIPEYFYVVLDDHHTVEDQEQITEFLDLFITYVDENCHVILASRTLPALPSLALLVARRQATGLSIDELRFTPLEIQALARQVYKLELTAAQASQLAERTGGWITGLLLTTAHRWERAQGEVAVRGRINVDLYDYLSKQVLDRQPGELREFLLSSSVLDELSPELCAMVLDVEAPAELMDQVRTRNLFITEFEGTQNRIRYHALFQEFLQDTLSQQDEGRFRELTLRAAKAYAALGEWERAVSRYLTLKQYEPVVQILERTAVELYTTGRWDTLIGWIDALPEEVRVAHPRFLVHRGKIVIERGDHEGALALLEQAEQAFERAGDRAGRAYTLAIKGHVLRYQGHYTEAIARCEEIFQLLAGATEEEERVPMALAYRNAGLCYGYQGKTAQGCEALQRALALYETLDSPFDVAMVHHDLGYIHELTGDLDASAEHYRAALQSWEQLGNPGSWANTLNGLGVVYHLQGKYEEALQTLDEALTRAQSAGDLRVEALVWASLGDLHRDLGAYDRAKHACEQALEAARRSGAGFVVTYARSSLGTIARLQGDLIRAGNQLQEAMETAREHDSDYEIGLCHTGLGILALDREDLAAAREHLGEAMRVFKGGGFKRDLALVCLYQAQTAFLAGEEERALTALERAMGLVEQLGTDQFLVVEGLRLVSLLEHAEAQGVGQGTLESVLRRIKVHRARIAASLEPVIEVEAQQPLEIYAFGPPRVELGGEGLQWTTTQSRDLFFCLLQHPHGLRKEEVGGMFWPDHPPRKLDGIFRSTLYRLRRSLFRESVLFDNGVYRFNREINYWFDVEAFEQLLDHARQVALAENQIELLEGALRLYKGDYLDGIYADWSALERERLRERCLTARELLAGLHAGLGSLKKAMDQYQQIVALDPYREGVHRELMRWHYRLGDRVAAIRQYQSCAQILREDLGLSPSPETEALYLKIIG